MRQFGGESRGLGIGVQPANAHNPVGGGTRRGLYVFVEWVGIYSAKLDAKKNSEHEARTDSDRW